MAVMVVAHPIPGFSGFVRVEDVGLAFIGGFTGPTDVPVHVQDQLTDEGFTLNAVPTTAYTSPYLMDNDVDDVVSDVIADPESATSVRLRAAYEAGSLPTVYVASDGDDDNPGLLSSRPKATAQAAHDALPAAGGRIVVRGQVNSTVPIVMTKPFILEGETPAARLVATSGHLFTVSTPWDRSVIRDITLWASTGHVLNIPTGQSINLCTFYNVAFVQLGNGYSIVNMPNGGMVDNLFLACEGTHTLAATVPSWNLNSATGALNANRWLRYRHNYSGNYVFHLECPIAQTYALDNAWNGLTLEVCDGGAIRLLSAMGCVVDGAQVWDLSGPTTRDLFVIGKSATGSASIGNTLRHLGRRAGALGSGKVDVRLVAGQVGGTTIDQCFDATLNNFAADLGDTIGTILGRAPAVLTNATGFTLLDGSAWRPYTPTVGGTGASLGDGTIAGGWTRTGRTIQFWARVDRGSTTTWGSSGIQIGLPVQVANQSSVGATGTVFRTGVNWYAVAVLPSNVPVTSFRVNAIGAGGAFAPLTDTAPWTAVAGDYILVQGSYEAAS